MRYSYDNVKVGRGDYADAQSNYKFGANSVGTSLTTIRANQTGLYVYPTGAEAMTVSSDDAGDTDGGAGAWSVLIAGLDENWDMYVQTYQLNGLTPVALDKPMRRLFRAFVAQGGSSAGQLGTIYVGSGTVTLGVPANNYLDIPFDYDQPNQTLMAIYTVPRGYTVSIFSVDFGVTEDKKTSFYMCSRGNSVDNAVWRVRFKHNLKTSGNETLFPFPTFLDEKTDLEIRAITATGTEEATVGFNFVQSPKKKS